ncbi:hypothetical protein, partial [Novacetimonas hansenii]|uniref:hypothetical protein n=1 Tax=Novacetimonas hansenii TaxID=436 RepID=UPI001A7EE204
QKLFLFFINDVFSNSQPTPFHPHTWAHDKYDRPLPGSPCRATGGVHARSGRPSETVHNQQMAQEWKTISGGLLEQTSPSTFRIATAYGLRRFKPPLTSTSICQPRGH